MFTAIVDYTAKEFVVQSSAQWINTHGCSMINCKTRVVMSNLGGVKKRFMTTDRMHFNLYFIKVSVSKCLILYSGTKAAKTFSPKSNSKPCIFSVIHHWKWMSANYRFSEILVGHGLSLALSLLWLPHKRCKDVTLMETTSKKNPSVSHFGSWHLPNTLNVNVNASDFSSAVSKAVLSRNSNFHMQSKCRQVEQREICCSLGLKPLKIADNFSSL